MKKIKFYPWEKAGLPDNSNPQPARKMLPSWLTNMSKYADNSNAPRISANSMTNMTVRSCPPFLDSMISGYTIQLAADVFVEQNSSNSFDFVWKTDIPMIAGHDKSQISKFQVSEEYFEEPFKWINHWSIRPPIGYSLLFTHPINRTDLPFFTFSGLVDTDTYAIPVQLPFLLKRNFSGIIKAGTPIAQVIPIKRESWHSSIESFDSNYKNKATANFFTTIFGAYKKIHWNRKSYK